MDKINLNSIKRNKTGILLHRVTYDSVSTMKKVAHTLKIQNTPVVTTTINDQNYLSEEHFLWCIELLVAYSMHQSVLCYYSNTNYTSTILNLLEIFKNSFSLSPLKW